MFFWEVIAPIVGYIILTWGVVAQTRKIIKLQESRDIALMEVGMRLVASILFFVKYWTIPNQLEIAIGQTVFLVIYVVYIGVVIKQRIATSRRNPSG